MTTWMILGMKSRSMLNRNASVYEKRFFITLIFHNQWEKYVSGSKVRLLSPAAICPTLNAVRSGIAAVDPTEVLHAVGEVIMGGVYSAGRGEGEVVVSHPGKRVIYK